MTTHTGAVGLVGLGQMGLPICRRLATVHDVVAFDVDEERRGLAESVERVHTTDSLSDIAACRRIVLSLPVPTISRSVLAELVPELERDTIVVETSTVLPEDVRDEAQMLESAGARVVDAAVLSGVGQMEAGKATLLVSGDDADIRAVRDILEAVGPAGQRAFGSLGSGMAAKVVNNGVAHATMVVLVEAFALAKAQGVALEDIADMLGQPDGGLMRPLTHRVMERVARGEYDGGMPLAAARKDSTLALAMAQRSGVPLFATQAAQTVYDLALAAGLEREDYAAIARLWQDWTGDDLAYGGSV